VAAGVGGFVRPGDKVDVLLTTTPTAQDDTGGGVTTTLLQNVQVLAVAQRLDSLDATGKEPKFDPTDVRGVTLLVSPDQAAKLDLGMNRGILHLALRNPKDEREARTSPATLAQLRFHQEQPFDLPSLLTQVAKAAGGAMGSTVPSGAQEVAGAKRQQPLAQIWTLRGCCGQTVSVDLRR
jgi:Flp pilus assembly protein CpaB